ncbi:hypothetical protein WSK_3267 [Novosphingobium sp. Rr 2-17]|uniref:lasso peptide biosynthesis B2 protein n=1 Tax=Novosphingobium sp. Rr 2-17 TaxID=555793 RepID=UPI0002698BF3|nr:lasso peptide biosynthesis B2 protein [Novosphingobium sp. Rr 2-17]EIZ78129.1 hypothetical protein WSK_3267 [Novosphingobium sp. Rr 2-17]
MTILLREGLSFCRLGNRTVFLDLPSDRYFGLSPATEAIFARACVNPVTSAADRDVLTKAGILGQTEASLPLRECRHPAATRSGFDQAPLGANPLTVARLLANLFAAKRSLHRRGLAATLADLAGLKPLAAKDDAREADIVAIAHAQRICARVIGSHDQCLVYAVAVARILFAAGAAADLVIGVAMPPFRAHAWVQWRDVLVNERVDIAAHYTPIKVV